MHQGAQPWAPWCTNVRNLKCRLDLDGTEQFFNLMPLHFKVLITTVVSVVCSSCRLHHCRCDVNRFVIYSLPASCMLKPLSQYPNKCTALVWILGSFATHSRSCALGEADKCSGGGWCRYHYLLSGKLPANIARGTVTFKNWGCLSSLPLSNKMTPIHQLCSLEANQKSQDRQK